MAKKHSLGGLFGHAQDAKIWFNSLEVPRLFVKDSSISGLVN